MVGCWDLCVWIEKVEHFDKLYVQSYLGKEDTRGGMMILVCPSPGRPYTQDGKKGKFAIENIHIVNFRNFICMFTWVCMISCLLEKQRPLVAFGKEVTFLISLGFTFSLLVNLQMMG